METPDVRTLPVLALLALVPAIAFALDRGAISIVLSVVCIFLVFGSLALMVGPSQAEVRERLTGR
jgi:hypothetical protein